MEGMKVHAEGRNNQERPNHWTSNANDKGIPDDNHTQPHIQYNIIQPLRIPSNPFL